MFVPCRPPGPVRRGVLLGSICVAEVETLTAPKVTHLNIKQGQEARQERFLAFSTCRRDLKQASDLVRSVLSLTWDDDTAEEQNKRRLPCAMQGSLPHLSNLYLNPCHLPASDVLRRHRHDIRASNEAPIVLVLRPNDPELPSPGRLVAKTMNCQQQRPKEEYFRCASEGFRFLTSDLSQGYRLTFTRFPYMSHTSPFSDADTAILLWNLGAARRMRMIWNRQAGTTDVRPAFLRCGMRGSC